MGVTNDFMGGWQPTGTYPPYTPRKQVKYKHPPFIMPKNKVHGRVVEFQPGASGGVRKNNNRD